MKKISLLFIAIFATTTIFAQQLLNIENVQKAYLKGAGSINENKAVKGYYVFYESDKIDRKTREYTIQILDENGNAVKKTTFQDSKDVILFDAEFNGKSICFFFANTDKKKYVFKIFDLNGKMTQEYEKEYDNGDYALFLAYANGFTNKDEDATTNTLISIPNLGFVSLLPVRQGGSNIFEIGYYSSEKNNSYVYRPEFEERQTNATCMAVVDSTIYLAVNKKKSLLGGKLMATCYAFNPVVQKKVFELEQKFDGKTKSIPAFFTKDEASGNLIMAATYYDEEDDIAKDYGLGIAVYTLQKNGSVINANYNSWQKDFAKYLPLNDKGKLESTGFLSIQDIQKTQDGKLIIAAEGYKRKFDGLGTFMKLAGGSGNFTKVVITDLVMIELDADYKVKKATIYPKKEFTGFAHPAADYYSQHTIALLLKSIGSFDYAFTSKSKDNSSISFCYYDWEKTDNYKGGTFNAIKYSNNKFTTDKIQLNSKAKYLSVLPAKQGYVGIYEYNKKEKKITFRLEKLN
ncbi:MAG: DUF6770 family protein [Chitinophagaceae bacterium]